MILVHCIALHCIVLYRIALTVVYNYIQLNRTTLNSLHSTCNLTRTCKFHKSETTHWSTCICHTLGNFTSHKPYTDLQVYVTRLKTSQVRNPTLIYRYLSHAWKHHKSETIHWSTGICHTLASFTSQKEKTTTHEHVLRSNPLDMGSPARYVVRHFWTSEQVSGSETDVCR